MTSSFPPLYHLITATSWTNRTLTTQTPSSPPKHPTLQSIGTVSSENWYLHTQSNATFLRNRDYGATQQLGVDTAPGDSGAPLLVRLMNSTGDAAQQWLFTTWDAQGRDVWRITNRATGLERVLGYTIPPGETRRRLHMAADTENGVQWAVVVNPGAERPGDEVLRDLGSVEGAAGGGGGGGADGSGDGVSIGGRPPEGTGLPRVDEMSSDGGSLSAGAIAGIVVGGVGMLLLVVGVGWWFHRRRCRRRGVGGKDGVYALYKSSPPPMGGECARVELPAEEVVELPGRCPSS